GLPARKPERDARDRASAASGDRAGRNDPRADPPVAPRTEARPGRRGRRAPAPRAERRDEAGTARRGPAMNEAEAPSSGRTSEFQWWQLRPPRRMPWTRLLGLGLVVIVLLSALGYGAYLWHYSQTHISTDDAFITGRIVPVSARVAGTVLEVLGNDNQDVKSGDVLIRLDPRDYGVALAQARASVEAARGELQNAVTNVPLADETTRSLL